MNVNRASTVPPRKRNYPNMNFFHTVREGQQNLTSRQNKISKVLFGNIASNDFSSTEKSSQGLSRKENSNFTRRSSNSSSEHDNLSIGEILNLNLQPNHYYPFFGSFYTNLTGDNRNLCTSSTVESNNFNNMFVSYEETDLSFPVARCSTNEGNTYINSFNQYFPQENENEIYYITPEKIFESVNNSEYNQYLNQEFSNFSLPIAIQGKGEKTFFDSDQPIAGSSFTMRKDLNVQQLTLSDQGYKLYSNDISSSGEQNSFKTPTLSSSLSKNPISYDALFDTPLQSKQLPCLTTPLFQPKCTGFDSSPLRSKSSSDKSKSRSKSSNAVLSPRNGSSVVIAITEGRGCAMGEVGLAVIDLKNPVLNLCQLSDCQTYTKTLTKIHLYDPNELIVPDTFDGANNNSDLFKRLSNYFGSAKIVAVKRPFFSGDTGIEFIRSLCLPEFSSVELIVLRKYYALAATSALLKYIEYEHNVLFSPNSLKICYECASGTVAVDLETVRRLELIMTQGEMLNPEKYSLIGVMNFTVTLGGKRRQRAEILQPYASVDALNDRLDIVETLINDRPFLTSLQAVLSKFQNVERLLWLCKKPPNYNQVQKANELLTSYILILKSTLENIPMLRELLSEAKENYFTRIRDMLHDKRLDKMKSLILEKIHHDAKPTRGHQAAEMNRCFAIKENINGLLDVARATYSKLIDDIQEIITNIAAECNLPLKMAQSVDLGFHAQMTVKKRNDILQLPEIFTDIRQKGQTIHASTDEIFSYNVRVRRCMQEIQIISNSVISTLVDDLKPMVGCLYILCENIADLDVICSLARTSCASKYVRPTFGEVTDIKGARHPILDNLEPTKSIPNDIFASEIKNFQIITGPNMGGKTVYVLQIALLQIMAQIGCFVPADSACFRVTDHIYVRKGSSDSIECRASSFTVEIKELIYTITTMTNISLIIIDEICTGTNFEGGTALAWAICEEFLKRSCYTFLTTHLHYLTNLEHIFTNVTNYHVEAIDSVENTSYGPLKFTYRLLKGVTDISNYGLKLMLTTALPVSIKLDAIKIVEDICRKRAASLPVAKLLSPDTLKVMDKVDKLEKFMKNLYELSKTDNFTLASIQGIQKMVIKDILTDDNEIVQINLNSVNSGHHQ